MSAVCEIDKDIVGLIFFKFVKYIIKIHMNRKLRNISIPWSVVLLMVLLQSGTSGSDVISQDLYEEIFKTYKSQLLPVCAEGPTFVNVTLNIALRQIINLDEKDQILKTNVWVRMGWNDCRLKWNSSTHNGVQSLSIPYDNVWTPDLALYDNAAEEVMMPGLTDYRAQVSKDGRIQYNFPTVLNSVCRVTVTYFPFDTQNCGLRFGSWSHAQKDIDFYPEAASGMNGELGEFVINNEWVVSKLDAKRRVKKYSENYTDINYNIVMTRRSDFYVMTMMFPCILVSAIAAIGFLLPSESGEKVSLEVTVLLSQAVFLLVISDFLPPSADDFPILGTYFAVSMLLVSMSLVMSVLVLNVHHRGDVRGKKVPKWTRRFLLRNPKSCCSNTEYDMDQSESVDRNNYTQGNNIEETNIDTNIRQNGTGSVYHTSRPLHTSQNRSQHTTRIPSLPEILDHDFYTNTLPEILLKEQNRTLRHIERHFVHTDDTDYEREDWQTLARVLDRIFLFLYVICFAIVTAVFVIKLNTHDDTAS